ncbi:MAG: class I SAM-dependent methyltransferase [Caldilineaceae bacterium]|nr:class I SAM-dependent methyltransferase [Caldilineaceae bacterium]
MSKHAATVVEEADETLMTYADAVKRGDYDTHVGNLTGKHDNVRSYWEDQLTRLTLRPYLSDLVARKRDAGEQVRILDLGSGAGQGYELLTKIDQRDLDLGLNHQRVMKTADVSTYIGVDLSESMVRRGNQLYAANPTVQFREGNLNDGLAAVAEEAPFDLYFCAYGSLSHLDTRHLHSLLGEIAEHAVDGSLVVMDLLGRNSLEWPDYWTAEEDAEKYREYSMSYLYRDVHNRIAPGVEVERFPIRFWTGDEIEQAIGEVNTTLAQATNGSRRKRETSFAIHKKFDRSIFVGRHIDTGEYNPNLKPMRRVVNQLHEDYMRTDLDQLFWEPKLVPTHPDERVNAFFHELMTSWNTLVDFSQARLQGNVSLANLQGWDTFSAPLQFALMTVDRVINSTEWIWYGDPRANMIEPQIGYALRNLEHKLQQGLGCGHGFVVILEVQKQ